MSAAAAPAEGVRLGPLLARAAGYSVRSGAGQIVWASHEPGAPAAPGPGGASPADARGIAIGRVVAIVPGRREAGLRGHEEPARARERAAADFFLPGTF